MAHYKQIEGAESVCGVCGKVIYVTPNWAYRCKHKKNVVYACSYGCMRRSEREANTRRYLRAR